MLCIPYDGKLELMLTSPAWLGQEKMDGHRVCIRTEPGEPVKVYNRSGELRQHVIPEFMVKAFSQVPFSAFFDGELVGTGADVKLWLFDLPFAADQIGPSTKYVDRYTVLKSFLEAWSPDERIDVVPIAEGEGAKRALLAWAEENDREGVIFKRADSRYMHGRRSPFNVKYKFRQDCDVIVLDKGVDGKDNLVLGAYEPGGTEPIEIGHCTALNGDGDRIEVGEVITVNYVHFSKGKRLVQPTLPRKRPLNDKTPQECTTDQFRRAFGK